MTGFYGYGRINVVEFGAKAGDLVEGHAQHVDGNGMHVVEFELDGSNPPPEFGRVGEVVNGNSGITLALEDGGVQICKDGRVIASGADDEDMGLTDLAAVMDSYDDCEVDSAIQQVAWTDGDIGGASSFWSPRYRSHNDTSDALEEAMVIDQALRGDEPVEAATVISGETIHKLSCITDIEQRRDVTRLVSDSLNAYNTRLNIEETD